MSKHLVKSANSQVPQRIAHDLQKYSRSALPQVREVNFPVEAKEQTALITAYKDLDQPAKEFALNQRRQLIIGVFTFVILGVGMMMGQKFKGDPTITVKRVVASEGMVKMIPKDAEVQSAEHYQHEKICYTESNGLQVCTTRTARTRN